jgi:hypothetical protein
LVALTVNAAIVLPLLLIVPLPIMFTVRAVYVPLLSSARELTLTVVAAGVLGLPVKFKMLNQLPVIIVGIAAPLVSDKLG